eukprot:1169483-Rhodomonas_salina.2
MLDLATAFQHTLHMPPSAAVPCGVVRVVTHARERDTARRVQHRRGFRRLVRPVHRHAHHPRDGNRKVRDDELEVVVARHRHKGARRKPERDQPVRHTPDQQPEVRSRGSRQHIERGLAGHAGAHGREQVQVWDAEAWAACEGLAGARHERGRSIPWQLTSLRVLDVAEQPERTLLVLRPNFRVHAPHHARQQLLAAHTLVAAC